MQAKLEKDVRFLKAYSVGISFVLAVLLLSGFASQDKKPRFEEVDVERINIIEKDGKLRMVISNQARQHPGIVNGKIIKREHPRPPGMIFFNHVGDEMGGLIFGDNGGKGHFGSLTWDKVKNDQTMGFRHLESDDGKFQSGLEMWQQPNTPSDIVAAKWEAAKKITDETARKAAIQALIDNDEATQPRLFLGKRRDNSVAMVLYDIKGKPRIRAIVGADGEPKLEFLDKNGNVIQTLPAMKNN